MDKLFEEFKSASKSEWLQKVEKDLKGKPMESLNWELEGATRSPFYHSDDLKEQYAPINRSEEQNTWRITEIIKVSTSAEANKQGIKALEGGCNALTFIIDEESDFVMRKVLKDIQLEWIHTEFICCEVDTLIFMDKLLTYVEGRGFDTDEMSGALYSEKAVNLNMFEEKHGLFPQYKLNRITPVENAKTAAEQLTSILKKTKAILKMGNDKSGIASATQFEISLSDNYYNNIAKVRALRILLSNVFAAYSVENVNPFIVTKLNTSSDSTDENYSIIKANAQSMSAAIGGTDMIKSDLDNHSNGAEFSNRIGRNISHLMSLESYISRTKDPAAGSYFFENLTDNICDDVWSNFQKLGA